VVPLTLSLYALSAEWLALEADLIAAQGEETPELAARLASLGDLVGEKCDAYRAVCLKFELHAANCQAEADRLRSMAVVADNTVKRLKANLLRYMEFRGVDQVQGTIWKAAKQRNSVQPLVVHSPPNDLPRLFQRVTIEPDTQALRAAADEAGKVVAEDGTLLAELQPAGHHLRFR
jgi:hypothetical protein